MITAGDIRLKIFSAARCSLQLRKIEIQHDKRSLSSSVIYHLPTSNSDATFDINSAARIAHHAIGHNRDATVDSSSRGSLGLNRRTAQNKHSYDRDQDRYESRAE